MLVRPGRKLVKQPEKGVTHLGVITVAKAIEVALMAPKTTLDIPPHCMLTLQALGRFGFAAARDLAALTGQDVDTVRSHLQTLERYGYARGRYFGTPYLRTEKRWWAPDRGYRARIAAAATEEEANEVRGERAALGAMVLRPDTAALLNRVASQIAPHVEDPAPIFSDWFDAGPLDLMIQFADDRFLFIVYADQALRRPRVWKRLRELRELFTGSMYHTMVITTTSRDRLIATAQLKNLNLPGSVGTVDHVLNPGLSPWWDWQAAKWRDAAGVASQVRAKTYTATEKRVTLSDIQLPFMEPRTTPVRGVATAAALHISPLAKRILELLQLWPKTARSSIMSILGCSSSQLADQFRPLRRHGLVVTERQGRIMYCLLTPRGIKYVGDRGRASPRELYRLLGPAYVEDERGRTVREGSLVRALEGEPEHHDLVMESTGLVSKAIRNDPEWSVAGLIPPRRGRLPFKPGPRASQFRGALQDWIPQASRRRQLRENTELVIFPDATIEVEDQAAGRTELFLEIELSSVTETEWRERLERYVLLSLFRLPSQIPLFVVPNTQIEMTALKIQTQWVLRSGARRWPAAFTTADLLRARGADGITWRVTSENNYGYPLRDLPKLLLRE